MSHPHRFETRLIHAGEPTPRLEGSVSMPIFQSSTFEFGESGDAGGYHDIRYIRLNNTPNHLALHAKLASLEGAEAALVTSSGMAAISTTLLALLQQGEHLLMQGGVYGGTHDLVSKDFPRLGIEASFLDLSEGPDTWKKKLRTNTKVLYVEAITNPLLRVGDMKRVVQFAKAHSLITIIDNTFATPLAYQPAQQGFDLAVHSATKYLNGHSDLVAGAVIGKAALVEKVKQKLDHFGGSLDPHACFLLHRGLKTLAVRVRHQFRSAHELARHLAGHPAVSHVTYPGLDSHPDHALAKSQLGGELFGGMISFELAGGVPAAEKLVRGTKLALYAPSLGGPETLISRPATSSHAGLTPAERARMGISDALVRVSVGLEAVEDLIADFDQALKT